MANGICVKAKIPANFVKDAAKPPTSEGKASASCTEVTTYVPKSPSMAAKNTANENDKPIFCAPLKTKYTIKGPTIAIEKAFAPNVVRPPCAKSKDWNNKTTVPITLIANGPNNTVPSPTPVGCEQLPVTDGIFKADRTNAKAPERPNIIFVSGFASTVFRMERNPSTIKGIEITHQKIAHSIGKKPSMICMAKACFGTIKYATKK